MKKTETVTPLPLTLEILSAKCSAPLNCPFTLDGEALTVPLRRLTPAQEEKIASIRREITPPLVRGRTPEEDRYNLADKDYIQKKEHLESTIRAMTIYEGCPMVASGKPGLTSREEIWAYVQGLLTNNILDILYLTIQHGGVKLAERVNFTSPPDSVQT